MSELSDHQAIGPILASHERAWSAAAHDHADRAEKARTAKAEDLAKQLRIPEEYRRRLEARHDASIAHHERQAAIHQRRAEYARAGYVLDGPDERTDAVYQKDHAGLIGLARRTARLRYVDDTVF
jgi:hypothetical protein